MNLTKTAPIHGQLKTAEFVCLMGIMTALVALSIDALMPAFPQMARDFNVQQQQNNIQLVIIWMFIGLAIGNLFYGTLSERWGRKLPVIVGFILFFIGSLLAMLTHNINILMLARLIQGLGLAGPRTISMTIARDLYSGNTLAKVTSFIMTVFILIPVIAPSLGQLILLFTSWRILFLIFIIFGLLSMTWFLLRQPETLPKEKRNAITLAYLTYAMKEILKSRQALAYSVSSGFISGAFISYISLAQPVFQNEYNLGHYFPLAFSLMAISIGLAALINGRLIIKFGAKCLSKVGVFLITGGATAFLCVIQWMHHEPPLWLVMCFMFVMLFSLGITRGNQIALAMTPLGHIAGFGTTFYASSTMLIGSAISFVTNMLYHNHVTTLITTFAVCGLLSILSIRYAETT